MNTKSGFMNIGRLYELIRNHFRFNNYEEHPTEWKRFIRKVERNSEIELVEQESILNEIKILLASNKKVWYCYIR
jgi:predicted transposase YbfD/YdcC